MSELNELYKTIKDGIVVTSIKVGFIAGIVRIVFFKKPIKAFFSEWILAAFVIYLAAKILPHYIKDAELIAGASAALGFLAREILQILLILAKGLSPALGKKLSKYLE